MQIFQNLIRFIKIKRTIINKNCHLLQNNTQLEKIFRKHKGLFNNGYLNRAHVIECFFFQPN